MECLFFSFPKGKVITSGGRECGCLLFVLFGSFFQAFIRSMHSLAPSHTGYSPWKPEKAEHTEDSVILSFTDGCSDLQSKFCQLVILVLAVNKQ